MVLNDNPYGVLCDPDEASAWVASFNEYKGKGGSDRQFWLSIWGCSSVSVDRKGGRESIYVPFPFAAMLGGLPPDMLSTFANQRGRNDGLIDRILFTFPMEFPLQHWTETELSEATERHWSAAINELYGTAMQVKDDQHVPHLVDFTNEAKRRWIAWFDAHADEMASPELQDRQAGVWSKPPSALSTIRPNPGSATTDMRPTPNYRD